MCVPPDWLLLSVIPAKQTHSLPDMLGVSVKELDTKPLGATQLQLHQHLHRAISLPWVLICIAVNVHNVRLSYLSNLGNKHICV